MALTGKIHGPLVVELPQVMPAMPVSLFVIAPKTPTTRVPCQVLGMISPGYCDVFPHWATENTLFFSSLLLIQSPGSEGSGSQPSPSFAIK